MAQRSKRKAVRIEDDLHHVAAMYAAKHRDGTVTALVRRLIEEAVQRDRVNGGDADRVCPTCRKILVDCPSCGAVGGAA